MNIWLRLGLLINKIFHLLASVGLLIAMIMVVINVCGRGLFSSPIMAAVEIVGLAGVFLISFALGITEKEEAHIVVQMVVSRFRKRIQILFRIFNLLLSLLTVALLIWGGFLEAWEDATTEGATTYVLRISRAPFRIIWVIGCLAFFGFLVKNLIQNLYKFRKR